MDNLLYVFAGAILVLITLAFEKKKNADAVRLNNEMQQANALLNLSSQIKLNESNSSFNKVMNESVLALEKEKTIQSKIMGEREFVQTSFQEKMNE